MANENGNRGVRRTQRDYTLEFKEKVVREFESTDISLSAISRKYGIQGESTVRRWLERYGKRDADGYVVDRRFRGGGTLAGLERKISSLEQQVVRLENEVTRNAFKASCLDAMLGLLEKEYRIEIRKVEQG